MVTHRLFCLRCGYAWLPKGIKKPKQCPGCKRNDWNTPGRLSASSFLKCVTIWRLVQNCEKIYKEPAPRDRIKLAAESLEIGNVDVYIKMLKEGIKDKNGLLYRLSVVGQIGMQERLTVTSPVTLGW